MNTIEKKSVNVGNYISRSEMDTITTAYKQDRWADTLTVLAGLIR